MSCRTLAATGGLLVACSFSGPGSSGSTAGGDDAGADNGPDAGEAKADAGAECAPVPAGVAAWWDGEELGVDRLGQYPMSEAFPAEDGPTVGAGLVGDAMILEEDEDIIFDPGPQSATFTVEAWIRRDKDDTGYMTIYGEGDNAGVFLLDHSLVYYDSDSANGEVAVGASTIPMGDYTHVAVTCNGAEVALYVDGVRDGLGAAAGADINLPDIGRVGGVLFSVGDGDGNDFVGQVDELTVYDRPLTQTEIAAIADAGDLGKCKE